MLGPALDVPDALAPQLLLKLRLPPPSRVLAPLVGQHLLRRPVRRNAARQRLHHQRRALVVRQRVRDDVARVVVHEGCQVQPLVASQEKREDVRLPHLIGRRPLEAPRPVLACRRRLARLEQPRVVQDRPHLRLAHSEPLETRQHVADATRAVLRMLRAQPDHRLLSGLRRRRHPARRRLRGLGHQRVHAPLLVRGHPVDDRCHAGTEETRELPEAHRPGHRLLDHPQPQRQRVRPAATRRLLGAAAALTGGHPAPASCLALPHDRLSFPFSAVSGNGGDGAR